MPTQQRGSGSDPSDLILVGTWFESRPGQATVLIETFCSLPQSFQVNAGIAPSFVKYASFSIHIQSLLFTDVTIWRYTPVDWRADSVSIKAT
jgi:hypothetical protein